MRHTIITVCDPCYLCGPGARVCFLHLDLERHEYSSTQSWNFSRWVDVTHETKNKVMSKLTKEDFNAIGCSNPDIYVRSRTDDTIILCPSKTRRKSAEYKGSKTKKHRHETNLRASDLFGNDWRNRLNPQKFCTAVKLFDDQPESFDFEALLRLGKVKGVVKSHGKIKVIINLQGDAHENCISLGSSR